MNIYRLIMFPDGRPCHREWIETDVLPRTSWEPFAGLFNGLRCAGTVATEQGNLRVLWNAGGNGAALGTFWLADQMFLAVVFAGGLDPASDEQLLDLAGGQWAGTELVKVFMGGKPSPFADLSSIPQRPLLVGMLAPALEPATYKEIAGVDVLVTAAFLERLREVSE
jgi:hypothetical protein